MKTAIIAINSKYIHSSLAPWYLKSSCGLPQEDVFVVEYSINDKFDTLLADICGYGFDVCAFSCYIWNIVMVDKLCSCIKKIAPNTIIVLGGPEVSYFDEEKFGHVYDYIIRGEGEQVFGRLGNILASTEVKPSGTFDFLGNYHTVTVLDDIPSPYNEEMLSRCAGKILYFESSRGCPNNCAYCLSSLTKGVRYFSLERVFSDLSEIINSNYKPRQVKFVDRTFNCNPKRSMAIIKFLIDNASSTGLNFHFEISADLMTEELMNIISIAPVGLLQFEAGVQTSKVQTLNSIGRHCRPALLALNINRLLSFGNIHLHLDLIAGLPGESLADIKESFNYIYAFHPHQFQLGFLKMLRGSKLRAEGDLHGYMFEDFPPYEVLCNKDFSFTDLCEVKYVEDAVDRLYNSGHFTLTLRYLEQFFSSSYEMYLAIGLVFRDASAITNVSKVGFYTILWEIGSLNNANLQVLASFIWRDFCACGIAGALPDFLEVYGSKDKIVREQIFDILKDPSFIEDFMPHWIDTPAKTIIKFISWSILYDEFDRQGVYIYDRNSLDPVSLRFKDKFVKL